MSLEVALLRWRLKHSSFGLFLSFAFVYHQEFLAHRPPQPQNHTYAQIPQNETPAPQKAPLSGKL